MKLSHKINLLLLVVFIVFIGIGAFANYQYGQIQERRYLDELFKYHVEASESDSAEFVVSMMLNHEAAIDLYKGKIKSRDALRDVRIISSKERVLDGGMKKCIRVDEAGNSCLVRDGNYYTMYYKMVYGNGDYGYLQKTFASKGGGFLSSSEMATYGVLLFLLYMLLLIVLSQAMRRIVVKPLRNICEHIRPLSRGVFDITIPEQDTEELKGLACSVIQMSQDLKEYQHEAEQSSKLVSIGRISSHIAHDMRSPLSVLKTYAGLKTAGSEDPDVENLRQSAERSVGKLERMAEDLVDYAKASKLQRAQHQLSGVIYEGAIAEAKKKAEEKGIKITSAIQGGIFVNVDAYKMERVITNLVNNAVQAIAGPGEVSIAATTEHNGVLKITVKDNGKGIDPEALPHIFDSFFTKGKKGGSGLGLAYCKQVIEAHGGTIDVESEVGKGTTFTIRIPNCAVEHNLSSRPSPVTPSGVEESLACHSRGSGNPETEVPGSPIKTLGDDMQMATNFLIADDDPEIRKQWEQIIPEHGGTIVHSAKTVKEVEDAELDYSKIDTAIVDYQFYGEDKTGIDLIRHLKAKGVKTVYLCTGFYDNEVIIKQAQAAGVERVLPKPIDPSLL